MHHFPPRIQPIMEEGSDRDVEPFLGWYECVQVRWVCVSVGLLRARYKHIYKKQIGKKKRKEIMNVQLHLHLKNVRSTWSYTLLCALRKSAPPAVSWSWMAWRKLPRTESIGLEDSNGEAGGVKELDELDRLEVDRGKQLSSEGGPSR